MKTDRLPPNSPESEIGVLGCILSEPDLVKDAADRITTTETFYDLRCRGIWETISEMHRKRLPVDMLTVSTRMKADGRLDSVGGMEFLLGLPDQIPSTQNLGVYIDDICGKYQLRRLLEECGNVTEQIFANGQPVESILEDAEIRFSSATKQSRKHQEPEIRWSELGAFDTDNDPNCLLGYYNGRSTRYVCKGYGAWLIGPSGIGKSSLMLQIAACCATGKPFFGIVPRGPMRILIVQAENDKGDLSEEAKGISRGLGIEPFSESDDLLDRNIVIKSVVGKIGSAFCAWLRNEIISSGADIVMVDPLLSFAGIDVSKQDQCSQFLRLWLNPILIETGAAMICIHHTGKPRREDNRGPQTLHERMYAGLGSSELVNWARAVMLVEPAGENAFRLHLAKRGKRAGAMHPDGEWTQLVWLQHARDYIFWEQIPPPQALEEEPKPAGRPSKADEVNSMNLHSFLVECKVEGETLSEIASRLENWLAKEALDISKKTCTRIIPRLVESKKLQKNDGLYFVGSNA